MISGSAFRVLFHSPSPVLFQSRGKGFIRREQVREMKFQSGFSKFCSLFVNNAGRTGHFKKNHYLSQGVKLLCLQNFLVQIVKDGLSKIPVSFTQHSVQVMKMCTRQCECVLAHRIRRGQQMFSLYTRLWDEVALKELIWKMKNQFTRRGKEFLLGIAGVTVYNWKTMRISEEEIRTYMNEIENVYVLRDKTVTCKHCHKRVQFDSKIPSVQYCYCGTKANYSVKDWTPFIERKDLLVWRKEDSNRRGLYAYKLYGSYDDVYAEDFLRVQLDIEYRKEWDQTAVEMTVVDTDPSTESDIIYWVMKWPRMFSNRDYVFNRRHKVNEPKKVMVVINKGTEHPSCPEKDNNIRVKDYWSIMVIKAHKNFNEPGLEFCLTYFDDPGVSIPSAITSWVAVSGLPDFMMRLRGAARQLALRREQGEEVARWGHRVGVSPNVDSSPKKSKESDEESVPEPSREPPGDFTIKSPLPSPASPHQDSQDPYTRITAARLFL